MAGHGQRLLRVGDVITSDKFACCGESYGDADEPLRVGEGGVTLPDLAGCRAVVEEVAFTGGG